jgi:hypothetical protein
MDEYLVDTKKNQSEHVSLLLIIHLFYLRSQIALTG